MENKKIEIVESFRFFSKNIANFFENHVLKKNDVNCSELSLLKVLYDGETKDKKMNVTEIASSLKISKSATSQLVSKLDKKGFVKRKINLFDKKINYITLTSNAKKWYEESTEKYNSIVEKVAENMGEEDSKELSRLLEKLSCIIYNLEEV